MPGRQKALHLRWLFAPLPSPQQSPFTTAFACLLTLVDFAFIVALEAVVTVCQDINLVR